MKRPKVFLEATPLINTHLSGVGHVVLQTLRALDTEAFANYDVRAFVPADEFHKLQAYDFRFIKPVKLPFVHKFFSLFTRLPFAPPLDLFLGRGTYIFFNFRNWTLLSSSSLTYIHDVCFVRYPQFVQPKNLHFLQKYMPLWLKRTDKVIAVSDVSRAEIQEYLKVPADKIVTIRNTVDETLYRPHDAQEIALTRQNYGLDRDYLLFVGNIEPRKNLETLVNAFSQSKSAKSISLFIVGGEGWLNKNVSSAITEATKSGYDIRRNTRFIPDEDVAVLMSGARALILPSWHEGFGLPALEALCSGTPVIASDIPGLREAVRGYENSVSFFDPDDSRALTELINTTLTTPKPKVKPIPIRTWADNARELIHEVNIQRSTHE